MARATSSGDRSIHARGRQNGNGHWGPIAQLAAEKFRDHEVLTREGRSGKVLDLLVDETGQYLAAVDFGRDDGQHEIPLSNLAYEDNHFIVRGLKGSDVRSLPAFTEGRLRSVAPETVVDVENFGRADEGRVYVQQAAAQVKVERPALSIHWDQPAPQVTVRQPTPQVNVRQMRPVILVRQPPPIVTVELQQPEIIVRMPEPDVDVSVAEAQVHVSVPKPNFQIMQPSQPVVEFASGDPVVSFEPRRQADIAIERAEPIVHYERVGEPQVIFRPAEGGPRIRFEEMSREEAHQLSGGAQEAMRESIISEQQTALHFEGRDVFDSEGTHVGVIRRVLSDPFGSLFLVLERDGFLARKRVLSIDRFATSGDRLVTWDLTDAQLKKMEDWDERLDAYVPVAADGPVTITRNV